MDPIPPPPKQALSGLAIAGLGCLGLFIVILVVLVIAVAGFRRWGPHREAGSTGNPGEIKSGELTVTQRVSAGPHAGALPAWAPSYPRVKTTSGNMQSEKNGVITGSVIFGTDDSVKSVSEFFQGKLKDSGFQTEVTGGDGNSADSVVIVGTKDGSGCKVNAIVSSEAGQTNVVLTYEGPKGK